MKFVDKNKIKVSSVTLNLKGKDVLQKCVDSLMRSELPLHEIIVVSNDPKDESLEQVSALYPDVVVLRNKENFGAPKGRNVGLRYALKSAIDYIFTLDNDLFINPWCISHLVEQSERHRNIGTVGAFIYDAAEPVRLLSSGGRVNFSQNVSGQFFKIPDQDGLMDVDYCGTGAMLTRRSVFDQIGMLDERFIGYGFEDVDFGFRVRKAGFRVCTFPKASVWHMPHSNIGNYSFQKKYLETRNAVVFMKKYASPMHWVKFLLYTVFGLPYLLVYQGIFKKGFSGVYGKYRGLLDGLLSREELATSILRRYR